MAKQTIKTGNSANDGNGDPARTAFTTCNNNFTEIYQYLGDGSTLNKLGDAALKNIGINSGEVMVVGAFGIGSTKAPDFSQVDKSRIVYCGFESSNPQAPTPWVGSAGIHYPLAEWGYDLIGSLAGTPRLYMRTYSNGVGGVWAEIWTTQNTTTDSNGFVKAASPIVQLFADKIELNDEAAEQDITFEKINVGHYLIKGSSGLSEDGWYIEQPKDANGNLYHVVEYQTLENGDIEIKTFDYMLDKRGRIVADHDTPLDIQDSRFISIRLNELPKTEYVPDEVIPDGTTE